MNEIVKETFKDYCKRCTHLPDGIPGIRACPEGAFCQEIWKYQQAKVDAKERGIQSLNTHAEAYINQLEDDLYIAVKALRYFKTSNVATEALQKIHRKDDSVFKTQVDIWKFLLEGGKVTDSPIGYKIYFAIKDGTLYEYRNSEEPRQSNNGFCSVNNWEVYEEVEEKP